MGTAENNRLRKNSDLEAQWDITIGQNKSNPVVVSIPCLPIQIHQTEVLL